MTTYIDNIIFEYKYARDNLNDESTKSDWDDFHALEKEYLKLHKN
jgi:hypothetical protein